MTQDTTDADAKVATAEEETAEAASGEETLEVAPVDLEDFDDASAGVTPAASPENLGRVMDVTVPMTARIGIVHKTISDVIDLAPGSIVDLERSAGDPIDLVIGDKLIARGEIVVVKDRYGVRIVEVIQDD